MQISYEEAVQLFWKKLGAWKIMALASSNNDQPMVRNVSCIFYNDKIYFKTDKNFPKTKQLLNNPNCAMCNWGVNLEGVAKNTGLVIDEPGRIFEAKYKEYLWGSYNSYSHEEDEILIEVSPCHAEIWDDDNEDKKAYQILIDFTTQTVEYKAYD